MSPCKKYRSFFDIQSSAVTALFDVVVVDVNVATVLFLRKKRYIEINAFRNTLMFRIKINIDVNYFGDGMGVHIFIIPSASPVATYEPLALLLH